MRRWRIDAAALCCFGIDRRRQDDLRQPASEEVSGHDAEAANYYFDPHNEYAAHFPGLAQIIDSESLELPFWMFKFDELADVVFSGRQPHADERDALYEVIRVARTKYQAELTSSAGTSAVRRQLVAEGIRQLPIRQHHIALSTSSQ